MVAQVLLSFAVGGSCGITQWWLLGAGRHLEWTLGLPCKHMVAHFLVIVIHLCPPPREFRIHKSPTQTHVPRVPYLVKILRLLTYFHRQPHKQPVRSLVCFGVQLTAPVFHSRLARTTAPLTTAPGMLQPSPAKDLAILLPQLRRRHLHLHPSRVTHRRL